MIPESPRLLCAKGRVTDLQKSINTMAWFNRTTVIWSAQELLWIEENAAKQKSAVKDKRGGAEMAKWFNADVLVSNRYTIAISNLPAETDKPTLIRMLTSRGMKDSDLSGVCVEMANSNSSFITKNAVKTNKKRKLSYSVSFKSEAEMIAAIKMLKSKIYDDGFDFEVSAVLPDPTPQGEIKQITVSE